MPMKPGKYDHLCTLVRERSEAGAALVIILDGNRGSGFSVQTIDVSFVDRIPELLEAIAQQIREEQRG